ncbi:YD repeat (two copies) [Lachnospiraceae bacterium 10-1]|nr:YD repeat (two copies) [Lachnospiraceae bacterium 10-1]
MEDELGARISYQYDARGNRTYEEQIIRSGIKAGENAGQEEARPVFKKIRYSYDRTERLVKKSELIHSC